MTLLFKNITLPRVKGSVKPGWSDYVAELYSTSRDVAKLWGNAGKPGQGYLFELHRTSKARFKFALRYKFLLNVMKPPCARNH